MFGYFNRTVVFDDALWAIVSIIVSVIVAFLMYKVFYDRPKSDNPNNMAGFFPLSDILSRKGLRTYSLFFSLPFAALIFIVCTQSSAFVVAAERLLETYLLQTVGSDQLKEFLEKLPVYLYPVLILAVCTVILGPWLGKLINLFRDLVVFAVSLDARANHQAMRATAHVQATIGIPSALTRLEANQGDLPPMPWELMKADLNHQFAFRLIQLASGRTREVGLDEAIRELLSTIDVALEPDKSNRIRVKTNVTAAIVFYLVVCGLYVFLSPLIGEWIISSSFAKAFLHPIVWANKYSFLITQLAQTSLSFVIPFAIGISAFDARRSGAGAHEPMFKTFIWVFQIVFVLSLFVNIVFALIAAARSYSALNTGNSFLILDEKFIADIFFTSLAPAGGLLAWVVTRRLKAPFLIGAALVCTASGLSLFICEYGYEKVCDNIIGYYWHQLFLGAVIVSTYFFAASMVGEVRGAASDGQSPAVPAPSG